MPAISFQREFLDALLRGDKQQTTRRQTDRIKVGDVCNIYIEQRRRITDKSIRATTATGETVIGERIDGGEYPLPPNQYNYAQFYHAHFLGKVYIDEVHDMVPACNSTRSIWAKADGFDNFTCADTWFTKRYGEDWMQQAWTVVRWNGWIERYFEPKQQP